MTAIWSPARRRTATCSIPGRRARTARSPISRIDLRSPLCGKARRQGGLFNLRSGRDAVTTSTMPEFSPQQDSALNAVSAWLKARPGQGGTPQIFRLFGYAGTGKTTLARHLAENVDGRVSF